MTTPSPGFPLAGNATPVFDELSVADLPVSGALPADLVGSYIRNGPNPRFPPIGRYHHLDGDGMLHAVILRDGRASYRNRWVRTPGWQAEAAAGRALWTGRLEPPRHNDPAGPFKNTANESVVWHAGRLLAFWEGGPPHVIRLPDLVTAGVESFGGRLTIPVTAHPKRDPATGELLFFGYRLTPPYLHFGIISSAGELTRQTAIDLPAASILHDFAMTERHAVFLYPPLSFGPRGLSWDAGRGLRLGVLPRAGDGGAVRWFAGPPGFVWHTLNAHDAGDEVVVVACRQADLGAGAIPRLHRWRLNLRTGTVHQADIAPAGVDFPRLNESRLGRPARYGYAARLTPDSGALAVSDGLLKVDLETGQTQSHVYGPGRTGGEAVFVPRSNPTAEDDGWLLSYVFDAATDGSELWVLAATDLAAPPLAQIRLPRRVPYGLHGTWVPAAVGEAAAG